MTERKPYLLGMGACYTHEPIADVSEGMRIDHKITSRDAQDQARQDQIWKWVES